MTKEISDDITIIEEESLGAHQRGREFSCLVMIYGEYLGRCYPIKSEQILIGRAPECNIQLPDDYVSRNHCQLMPDNNGVFLSDLKSTNGTFINGKPVSSQLLRDGDQIKIGCSIFKFLTGDNIERAYHEEIYRLKITDSLTSAFNKRYFEKELNRLFSYKRQLSLLMIDIDNFKQINDENGHLTGDRILSQLGMAITSNIRFEDTFCRYGGEEFAVLMPDMDLNGAIIVAERLRKLVADTHFEFEGLDLRITISIGVAEKTPSLSSPEEIVKIADEQLYAAKNSGRNRVIPEP